MDYLQQVLQDKLIPRARAGASTRIVVAQPHMSGAEMPPGVKLKYRKIPGKRVIVRGGRNYGNIRLVSAKWPEAGMHELGEPRFVCVLDGVMNYQAGNYLLGCRAGDFIFLPSHTPHPGNQHVSRLAHCGVPGGTARLLFMALRRGSFQCWASDYTQDQRFDTPTRNYLFLNTQVLQIFGLLLDELLDERNEQLCNSLLLAFMTALQREVVAGRYLHPGVSVVKEAASATGTEFVRQLESYVGQHISGQLTIESLARQFYMSRTQFAQRIRRETGKTLVEYLTDYRIQEAKILLAESEWTVQAIAGILGFKSPTYFHTLFLRQMGCSPGAYRKTMRESSLK